MALYDVPGRADDLPAELVAAWNQTIKDAFDRQPIKTRFFALDFNTLKDASSADIHWPGDPAEPVFCADEETAEALSDWGVRGRHELHNEYCEYAVVSRPDGTDKNARPKRIEVTTELREYWVTVAKHDPERVRSMAGEVLGREVEFNEMFGDLDPRAASAEERELAFCRVVAGNGRDRRLIAAGVPAQPTGELNTERALFMTHPINGLDDLLGIVLFGTVPYARRENGEITKANRDEIFASEDVQELACRHADPAAAMAAYETVFQGGKVAFANPIGMYMREPTVGVFSIGNEPVPKEWIRFDRGEEGMRQRLVFGPGDDDDAFLDDITVSIGASERPLSGGFQLVRQIEIGPLLLVGSGDRPTEDKWKIVPAVAPIDCATSDACKTVRVLKQEFDAAHAPGTNGG